MDNNEFDDGMDLAFRINELRKDVAAFLKDNYSSTAALPIFSAESQLHRTVGNAVHRTFREMLHEHPEMREQAEKEGISKEKIDKILSEGEASSEEVVDFDPIK